MTKQLPQTSLATKHSIGYVSMMTQANTNRVTLAKISLTQ